MAAVARQLLVEKVKDPGSSWKRATLLDKLQFDVFRDYWRKHQYDFSTFFLNSTAHYQHAYWHLAFPTDATGAEPKPNPDSKESAILYGYQEMDRLLGRFEELEQSGALLVLSTALSQQANPVTNSVYYRVRETQRFFQDLGLQSTQIMPVMAHQYSAHFASGTAADSARAALLRIKHNGQPVFQVENSTECNLFFGNQIRHDVADDAVIDIEDASGAVRREKYCEVFYKIPHTKSGIHHPDSVLWFKTGTHQVHSTKVSILDVLPTILDYHGVTSSPEDGISRIGRSLLAQVGIDSPHSDASRPEAMTAA